MQVLSIWGCLSGEHANSVGANRIYLLVCSLIRRVLLGLTMDVDDVAWPFNLMDTFVSRDLKRPEGYFRLEGS